MTTIEESKQTDYFASRCLSAFFCNLPGKSSISATAYSSLRLNSYTMKRRTYKKIVVISARVEAIRLVKIHSYTRMRNGKEEKVRSHWRKVSE